MTNNIRRWREPLHNESLAKQVYHSIQDAVFSGELQPGQAIREMHVARSLEVSQATVREALVQLQQTGLVVREQNRRTIVSAFTREEIRERLKMRQVLEELAAVEAAQRANSEDLIELERLAQVTDETVASGQALEGVRADIQFHRFLWRVSGNVTLAKTLDQTTTPLFAFLTTLSVAGLVDLSKNKPHTPIVAAIRSRDEGKIRHEIQSHLDGLYRSFLESGLPSLDAITHQSAFLTAPKPAASVAAAVS
jgi:DNA-binding GntR family transcriptional regulator